MHNQRQLIENYIVQINKPFCAKDISNVTGVPYSTVAHNLVTIRKEGIIKPISGNKIPRYYRYVRKKNAFKKTSPARIIPKSVDRKNIFGSIGFLP
jgi:hypothetical protein